MVARGGERVGQTRENALAGVVDDAGLAVQEFGCPVDGGAECGADRLVSEAHPEKWRLGRGTRRDQVHRRACALRCAGAGAQQNAVELGRCRRDGVGPGEVRIVVAPDHGPCSQLSEVLDQVEHEAVVVVDDENPHGSRVFCPPRALHGRGPFGLSAPRNRARYSWPDAASE